MNSAEWDQRCRKLPRRDVESGQSRIERVGNVTDKAHINPVRSFGAGKSSVFQGIRRSVGGKAQKVTAEARKMTFRDPSLAILSHLEPEIAHDYEDPSITIRLVIGEIETAI